MRWRRSTGVRSLYLRIYLTVVVVLLVFALIAAVLFRRHAAAEETRFESAVLERTRTMAALIERSLPPASAPEDTQREVLLDWSRQLKLPLALDDASGRRIAESEPYRRILEDRARPESEIAGLAPARWPGAVDTEDPLQGFQGRRAARVWPWT